MKDRKLSVELPAAVGVPLPGLFGPDETLVADVRAGLTPSQMVDRKLACQLGLQSPRKAMGAGAANAPVQILARQPGSRETSPGGR